MSTEEGESRKTYVWGSGNVPIPVPLDVLDEANTEGFAYLDEIELAVVPAKRILYEVDVGRKTRRPIAVLGRRTKELYRAPDVRTTQRILKGLPGRLLAKRFRVEDLVNFRTVAKWFRVEVGTLREWRRRHGFPKAVVSGWYDRRDVIEWAREHRSNHGIPDERRARPRGT
jgi:hypothetical protein